MNKAIAVADEVLDPVSELTDVAEYNPIAAGFLELRATVEREQWDIETTEGNKRARAFRASCVSLRTRLTKAAKDAKLPHQEAVKKLNDDLARLTTMIKEIEDPIDQKILALEAKKEAEREAKRAAEEARVQTLIDRITAISAIPDGLRRATSADIQATIDRITVDQPDDSFEDFIERAKTAHAQTLVRLAEMHADAVKHEAEAERMRIETALLAHQRRQQAEEQKRIDEAKAAQEREAAEARAAIERERQEAQAKADAEAAERDRAAREAHAELDRQRAEVERLAAEVAAAKADQERRELEARARAKEAAEAEERAKAEAAAEKKRQDEEAKRIKQAKIDMAYAAIGKDGLDLARAVIGNNEGAAKMAEAIIAKFDAMAK